MDSKYPGKETLIEVARNSTILCCVVDGCGKTDRLCLHTQKSENDFVTGFIFVCKEHESQISGMKITTKVHE